MLAANAIVNTTADKAIIDGAVSNRGNLVFFISDTSKLLVFDISVGPQLVQPEHKKSARFCRGNISIKNETIRSTQTRRRKQKTTLNHDKCQTAYTGCTAQRSTRITAFKVEICLTNTVRSIGADAT